MSKNNRIKKIERKTKETDISLELNLDGNGTHSIKTGIGFFDHMLELFACHSGFDLKVECNGDLRVDGHHSVEDIGIVLGKALAEIVGNKKGLKRYGQALVPMDESLARCIIDFSGRAFLVFNADLKGKIGDFDAELVEEFFRAVATNAGLTLHIELLYGTNAHHKAESIFKSFARALKMATTIDSDKVLSSKGVL